MTIPDSPITALWLWVAKAPTPVLIAMIIVLASLGYSLDLRVSEQEKTIAKMSATLDQVDTNVQTLLSAVLWANNTTPPPKKEKK